MTKLGLKFSENMTGTYRTIDPPGAERRFMFHVDALTSSLWRTLRDGRIEATGYVEADGLAAHAPLTGFLVVKPVVARFIRYEFDFTGDDGQSYHYAGQKRIRHLDPFRSWTTLPGSVFAADGREVASSTTYFQVKDLVPFLLGYRPVLLRGDRALAHAPAAARS